MIKWVRSLPKPIGIYAVGDMHAVRLLDACHEIGVAVPEEVAILSVGNDPLICETVRPTISSLDLDSPSIGYIAAELLDRMMAGKRVEKETIYTQPSHVVKRQSTDVIAVDDPDLVSAATLIRQWACRGITVPRVVHEIGLSRSVLDRRFRQSLGRTPKAEIMRVRIENAKRLLAETTMNLRAVAKRSGFSSLGYFIKAFRRETGMTARVYRGTRMAHAMVRGEAAGRRFRPTCRRPAEIMGKHFSCFYSAEAVQRGLPEQELQTAAKEGRFEDEGWRVRKDGKQFWANAIISALRDKDGTLRGFAKVTRDLTERKEAEERIQQQSKEIMELSTPVMQVWQGVVMALARLDWGQGRLVFASVGNIAVRVFPRAEPCHFVIRRGVIGLNAPSAVVTEHPWSPDHVLVLHSDGVATHWGWKDFPGWADRPAAAMAQELLRAKAKDEDDATVIVVRNGIP